MKKTICVIFFLLLTSTSAWSLTIYGDTANSTENLGNFIGELTYTYNNNADAQLLVELTNTSPASNGGFITAFAFTNPENFIITASLSSSSDPDFGLIGDDSFNNTIAVNPFDPLDIGGASTNSWLGGGNPNGGIAVGDTETFTFIFSGNNLSSLDEIDFLPALQFVLHILPGYLLSGSIKLKYC